MNAQSRVRVDLTVVHEGGRRMDSAPDGVSIGVTQLRRWQVDRIDAPMDMFDGCEAYLVKINYDLEINPDSPPMPWFEVAFDFLAAESGRQVAIVDALPRFSTSPEVARPYVLNRFLNFVPSESDASAQVLLPASTDRVDMFGAGGSSVRWRHVSLDGTGVRPGSYAAWVVLLIPAGQVEQRVEFSAQYGLAVPSGVEYRPTQRPAAFVLTLGTSGEGSAGVRPSLSAPAEDTSREYQLSVFICYAHESLKHKEAVREFGDLLSRHGIFVHMDQKAEGRRMDWATWALKTSGEVDFVIVIASPLCRKAFDGGLCGTGNPGIRSEARIIGERLHAKRDEWTAKVLPVVLPHEFVDNIPEMLQPWTSDHYDIRELTSEGIQGLLRAMKGASEPSRPLLG
ncbi:toll/interleukin-1 receptor domain-containing protein [Streptomyces sp. OfavH-34-F]|uniref:toll/interleukin-1 receptor domain-containing protein n=1 Tax=Streptomyces sp. OfavH-34-F TaxID=2917760 RepID=UPI001EF2DF55|nr:toll/interleukin-1 receptor domain-containing protein [Streptomyces sp. OfavH-34-F]MCG7524105.1 toll/interleukin-1 receptor domain-containing protein [Streptomyces sp. OfavH-34-F]